MTLRRSAIRPVSKKRAATGPTRRALTVELITLYPWCVRCGAPAVELHEPVKRSRRPGCHLDRDLCLPSCRDCNEWAEREPAAATAEGWLIPSGVPYDEAVAITKSWLPARPESLEAS